MAGKLFGLSLFSKGGPLTLTGFLAGKGYRVEWLTDGTSVKGFLIPGGSGTLINGGTGVVGTERGRRYLASTSTVGFNDPTPVNYAATDYFRFATQADASFNPLVNPVTALIVGTINLYSSPGVHYADYNGYPDTHGIYWGESADLLIPVGSTRVFNTGVIMGQRLQIVTNLWNFATKNVTTNQAIGAGSGGSPFSQGWLSFEGASANQNQLYYMTVIRFHPSNGALRNIKHLCENNARTLTFVNNSAQFSNAPSGAFIPPSSSPIIQIGPVYQGNVYPSMHKRHRTMITALIQGYVTDSDFLQLANLIKQGVPG